MPDSTSRKQIAENKTKIYVAEGAVTYNLMSVVPEKEIVYINVDKGVENKTAKSKKQNIKSQQPDKIQKNERPLPKQKTIEIRPSPEDDSLSRQAKRAANLVLQNPIPKIWAGIIENNFPEFFFLFKKENQSAFYKWGLKNGRTHFDFTVRPPPVGLLS